jgi:hypothetical protein
MEASIPYHHQLPHAEGSKMEDTMSFLSARLTKLRVAIGAGAIVLGLAAAGAAAPAQAEDYWHNDYRADYRAHAERERAIERERAAEHAREVARAREAQRHEWYEHHYVAPHTNWFYR